MAVNIRLTSGMMTIKMITMMRIVKSAYLTHIFDINFGAPLDLLI